MATKKGWSRVPEHITRLASEHGLTLELVPTQWRTADVRATRADGTTFDVCHDGESADAFWSNVIADIRLDAREQSLIHERAHAGISEPDTCDRGANCPARAAN